MRYSRSLTVWTVVLALIFFLGLLIFVYFQGGVDSAIRLSG
jgi:preprotein translocase subunit SecG